MKESFTSLVDDLRQGIYRGIFTFASVLMEYFLEGIAPLSQMRRVRNTNLSIYVNVDGDLHSMKEMIGPLVFKTVQKIQNFSYKMICNRTVNTRII